MLIDVPQVAWLGARDSLRQCSLFSSMSDVDPTVSLDGKWVQKRLAEEVTAQGAVAEDGAGCLPACQMMPGDSEGGHRHFQEQLCSGARVHCCDFL